MYYVKGNPQKSVAPDVFVVFGVKKRQRRTYRLWEEEKEPDFVLELVSQSTYRKDLGRKKRLYASVLKVKEYFLYDPDDQYLPSRLTGYRLVDDVYLPIRPIDGRLPSLMLGLELGEKNMELGLYNPQTKCWLLKPAEEADARRRAEARAERAEAKAQQEAIARQQAEAELARLRALFDR